MKGVCVRRIQHGLGQAPLTRQDGLPTVHGALVRFTDVVDALERSRIALKVAPDEKQHEPESQGPAQHGIRTQSLTPAAPFASSRAAVKAGIKASLSTAEMEAIVTRNARQGGHLRCR